VSREYVIDGSRITSLEAFWDEISNVLIPGHRWGRNLDAFRDILSGLFGPDEPYTLRWRHAAVSIEALGHPETVRQLEMRLKHCHPDNRERVRQELADARAGRGPTVFDWLIEIIRDHGPGGRQASDDIRLVLD
jgi:RNAse (barnase) inhibitor barstar